MVVKVVKKIDTTVELVEKASCYTETLVQKLDRTNDGTCSAVSKRKGLMSRITYWI